MIMFRNNIFRLVSMVLMSVTLACFLMACRNEENNDMYSNRVLSEIERIDIGDYLFNADKMESIEISGKDLLKRKETEISTEIISDNIMKFVIKRDNTGPCFSMAIYFGNLGVDLVSNLEKSVDQWCGPKEDFYYQMASYDFNHDGVKEIIVAGGDKKDTLELNVFRLTPNFDFEENKPQLIAEINDGYKSYINEKDEICVIKNPKNEISIYSFNGEECKEKS